MSDGEGSGGLFRGKERTSLLILAGIVVTGWGLVLYYGLAKAKLAPPGPAPISALPPLPPADPSPAFALVRDVTPRSFRDAEGLALLTARTRQAPPGSIEAQARREVSPLDLLRNPARYRGLPIHLDGFASKVFAVDGEDPAIAPRTRLYEVWFRSIEHDQGKFPCCLLVEDAPTTLPGGKDLDERVAFDGYFFKLLSYQAGDAKRFAPMLVGRLVHFSGQPSGGDGPGSKLWMYLGGALVAGYVVLRILFKVLAMRRPSETSRRPRQDFPTERETEPDALDRWLNEPKSPDEAS